MWSLTNASPCYSHRATVPGGTGSIDSTVEAPDSHFHSAGWQRVVKAVHVKERSSSCNSGISDGFRIPHFNRRARCRSRHHRFDPPELDSRRLRSRCHSIFPDRSGPIRSQAGLTNTGRAARNSLGAGVAGIGRCSINPATLAASQLKTTARRSEGTSFSRCLRCIYPKGCSIPPSLLLAIRFVQCGSPLFALLWRRLCPFGKAA